MTEYEFLEKISIVSERSSSVRSNRSLSDDCEGHLMFVAAEHDMFLQVGDCMAHQLDVRSLESEQALDEYLERERTAPPPPTLPTFSSNETKPAAQSRERYFLLSPTFGWGRLQITQNAMSKLVDHYQIFPTFSRQLKVFGEKDFARDEGFSSYKAVNHYDQTGHVTCLESCFLWKYVEPGGLDGRFPYSIRQSLIYQKFETRDQQSTNILVRVSRKLAAEIKAALTTTSGESEELLDHWTSLQMMCAESGLDEWRDFNNYLDKEVTNIFDTITVSSTGAVTHGKADELQHRLTNMKRLQFFIDQILRGGHMLELNKTTVGVMKRSFSRRKDILERSQELSDRLEDIQQEYEYLIKMSKHVLDRAIMLSSELRDTVALRNHEINKETSISAAEGTDAMVQLSKKSAYEAQVVKILSVVAIVFLPASFAADFLQMGYLFVTKDGRFAIHATEDMWLYAIFAIPLLIVTLTIYVVFEMLSRKKARRSHSFIPGPHIGIV